MWGRWDYPRAGSLSGRGRRETDPYYLFKAVTLMDWQAIITAVSSVGFPIVAAIALFWVNEKNAERHQEEMNKLTETLAQNTLAIQTLSQKLDMLIK